MLTREGKLLLWLVIIGVAVAPLLFARATGVVGQNAPRQPIDFFHRVHAGDKRIQCGYCHAQTATANFAGMPSTELCMRCHRVIIPNHPEIQKLHSYYDQDQAVPWLRVNHLPGFVIFSHQAHIAKNVPCATCHGDLTKMDRVRQAAPLTMGWCLNCHRAKKAPTDCWTCHK